MRILHLVQCGPTTGGTVSHVAAQVAHQVRLGLEIAVVAASDGVLTELCREAGADVFVDPTLSATHPGGKTGAGALLTLGRRWGPHLVHAHLMHAAFRGAELAAVLDVPLLYTQHMYNPVDPFLRAVRASGLTVPTIAVAAFAARELRAYLADSAVVHLVPNGVDVPAPSDVRLSSSAGPQIIFCGRLSPEKGADTAVLAFSSIVHREPDARLHLIGTGPEEPLLRRLVGHLGLDDQVRFVGSISGALTSELGADVVLASSRAEAASLVIMEAMASRIPIVATAVGGTPELVRSGVDGLLVAPDDPDALAEAAMSVLRSEERGASLVQQALDRYETLFTAARMVERTCGVYETVLGKNVLEMDR